MTSALEIMRQRIKECNLEETPDGLVAVIYNGKKGIRLVVDPETGRAIASSGKERHIVVHQDPALAAMRAASRLIGGGIA